MSTQRKGQLHLGVFFNHTGHHVASWLHPKADIDAGINRQHYIALAQSAERAKFDFLFFADSAAVRDAAPEVLCRSAQYTAYFEPITLLSALSVVTEAIGLVATATTSYNEPYHVGRKFASLDHLSSGRAGWNVVTSGNKSEAYNFGRDEHYNHEERYARAREFIKVVQALWDSWDDDAFIRDRKSGVYFDPAKLHMIQHRGQHFAVRGPLNVPRPPQGYPVIFQAGTSEDGRELAAESAEAVFTAELNMQSSQAYYADVKSRMGRYGRRPDELRVMPGINPIVGRTDKEAHEKHDYLQSLIHPDVGKEFLSTLLGGFSLTKYSVDGPLPDLPSNDATKMGSVQNIVALARRENLSIRQLYMRLAGARGKLTLIGSYDKIADEMERWFHAGAADGFIIHAAYHPGALEEFNELVVPELQSRKLFRTEYTGNTLRDHLGLQRPQSRFSARTSGLGGQDQ